MMDDKLYARITPVLIPVMHELYLREASLDEQEEAYGKVAAEFNVSLDDVYDAVERRANEMQRKAKIQQAIGKVMKASAAKARMSGADFVNIPNTLHEGFPDILDAVPDVTIEEVFEIANKDWGDFLRQQAH